MPTDRILWPKVLLGASGALCASVSASANNTPSHTVQHGESLSTLARKYHLNVQDLVVANHLKNADALKDGMKLVIPPPPAKQFVKATMRKPGFISGDRISLRMAPAVDGRRIDMFDMATPLTVTADKLGWYQVTMADGRQGWIRQDFVKLGAPPVALAAALHKQIKLAHSAAHAVESHVARHITSHHFAASTHTSRRHGHSGRSVASVKVPAGSDVVRTAYAYRGTPYHFGGTGRNGFDCSGFTSYVYGKKGVALPHNAAAQFAHGAKVTKGELKPGDLVFFHCGRRGISHVGIFVGNGKFVHASSPRSGGVRVDSLNDSYYKSTFRGARRVKK